MSGLLHQLQVAASTDSTHAQMSVTEKEIIEQKILEFNNCVDNSNKNLAQSVQILQHSSQNVGAKYHWLIFVAIYGAAYVLGG